MKGTVQTKTKNDKPDLAIMDKLTQPHGTVDEVAEKLKQIEIDQSKLTALSPEVISRQATVSLQRMCKIQENADQVVPYPRLD